MSEALYSLLLRLYPRHFRQSYGDEALLLFRDRLDHEQGLFLRLRLWLDLLVDLLVSVPREHRYALHVPAIASRRACDGLPGFEVLESEWPDPRVLLSAFLISLALLLTESKVIGTNKQFPSADTSAQNQFSEAQGATNSSKGLPGQPTTVKAGERQFVVNAVIKNLRTYYFDKQVAQKTAETLLMHEKRGEYDNITDGATLASLLAKQMRTASDDVNLTLDYSDTKLPESPAAETPAAAAAYRTYLRNNHCFIAKVEVSPAKIGYLKLDAFAEPSACQSQMQAAMASLNEANAVIFDLRENRGGDPEMVSFVAAYLFDHPEYWYNPREAVTKRSWTKSPVAGNKLSDKPVYVLTSATTWSGAEQFCYNLKMLHRATLIGQTTGGGAHAGVFHRIDDHFGMGIPEVRTINPFAKHDWEGVGVEPDIHAKTRDALTVAERLAAQDPRSSF